MAQLDIQKQVLLKSSQHWPASPTWFKTQENNALASAPRWTIPRHWPHHPTCQAVLVSAHKLLQHILQWRMAMTTDASPMDWFTPSGYGTEHTAVKSSRMRHSSRGVSCPPSRRACNWQRSWEKDSKELICNTHLLHAPSWSHWSHVFPISR